MNMTGDPNQQNRPSLFGFDYTYPNANPVDWGKFQIPTANAPNGFTGFSQAPMIDPQITNFSFCTSMRPPPPVQFPFVTDIPPTIAAPQPVPVQSHREESNGEFGNRSLHIPIRCKRKTDAPLPPVTKQHITDEKMAQHMAQLHISSETATSTTESEPVREQRLYMCEEMRRLQQESILPQALLNKINRPCTALVLWSPPPRIPVVEQVTSENNNEESEPDNNVMEMDALN